LQIATDARSNDFDAMVHERMVADPDDLRNGSHPDTTFLFPQYIL
jgi:hypothetical protein